MKKISLLLPVVLYFGLLELQAQQVGTASGGNASGSGGTVSYSVGQTVYFTYTGTDGSTAQGVQQPYEISVVTGMEETLGISLEIMVYPNPATEFITLKIENYEIRNLNYQLYDMNARLLYDHKIVSNETSIVMQNLKPSIYLLKVTDRNKVIKTFKIIKN